MKPTDALIIDLKLPVEFLRVFSLDILDTLSQNTPNIASCPTDNLKVDLWILSLLKFASKVNSLRPEHSLIDSFVPIFSETFSWLSHGLLTKDLSVVFVVDSESALHMYIF